MTSPFKVFVSTLHAGDLVSYMEPAVQVTSADSYTPLSRDQLIAGLQGHDALVGVIQDKIDEELLTACPQLKVVANVAVGYDNVDLAAAKRHGVLICNTPGVLDGTTADMAFALLLAVARRVVEADQYVRQGKWKYWTTDLLLGTDLGGKTLGIVGMGRIGQAMARRARGFDMHVLYTQRNPSAKETEQALNAHYVSLGELLTTCDFLSIHCPLTAETRHLIGKDQLALMNSNTILINTARGAIVDERALVEALQTKKIKGAGLDVMEHEPAVSPELLTMDNVVLAPHIGSASVETRWAMARLAADGVLWALSGNAPDNAVNPQVWPDCLERLKTHGA